MSAQHNLNDIQFSHHNAQGKNWNYNVIEAHAGDNKIGEMYWAADTGRIQRVEVQGRMGPNGDANGGSYQHRGIATHMYRMAQEIGPEPQHSSNRTPAGTGWAKHVGGHLPPNRKAMP